MRCQEDQLFWQLQKLVGQVVTKEAIEEAAELSADHFKDPTIFNRKGWEYILDKHDGRLPLEIKAVPEGTIIPTKNILMSVSNKKEKRRKIHQLPYLMAPFS